MDRNEILARVRSFVNENFMYMRPDFALADDASLMGNGIVDSMGVMEMIEFLESEFGVKVDDAEITEENLGSLRAISDYVAMSMGAAGQQAR